jgi:hypothetical protein
LRAATQYESSRVGKHRHERFRPGYAVVRIDEYDIPGIPEDGLITVKEAWSSKEQADAEVARLNAINADKSCRYFAFYTRAEREA